MLLQMTEQWKPVKLTTYIGKANTIGSPVEFSCKQSYVNFESYSPKHIVCVTEA